MGTEITSIGYELPPNRVSNEIWREQFASKHQLAENEFSRFVSGGIEQRFYWNEDDDISDAGARAARNCLTQVHMAATEVEHIIHLTNVTGAFINGEGPKVQAKLGASASSTFDLTGTSCAGFLVALNMAHLLVESGTYQNVLIVCVANVASRAADQRDVTASVLGDLATAILVTKTTTDSGLKGFVHHTRGQDYDLMRYAPVPDGKHTWPSHASAPWANHFFHVDPRQGVLMAREAAQHHVPAAAKKALARAGRTTDDIRWAVTHQPGTALLRVWDECIGIDPAKHPDTMTEIANASFSSIPYTLRKLIDQEKIESGDDLLFLSPGSGQHAVSVVWRW